MEEGSVWIPNECEINACVECIRGMLPAELIDIITSYLGYWQCVHDKIAHNKWSGECFLCSMARLGLSVKSKEWHL